MTLPRSLLALLVCCTAIVAVRAQPALPLVDDVKAEQFQEHCNRLVAALRDLKVELSPEIARDLENLPKAADTDAAIKTIQRRLDAYCLLGVSINPESRVKVARGPAEPTLVRDRDNYFLAKIQNEGGVTSPLAICGPQIFAKDEPTAGRWLDAGVTAVGRLQRSLSGQRLEYVILRLRGHESGKREATLRCDVGQGTQDLGFRAEVPILFIVKER